MLTQRVLMPLTIIQACDNSQVRHRVYNLLLVEDNPADVALFKHACRDSTTPRRLHVATDGVEAMRFLQKGTELAGGRPPAWVGRDWNLPGVGGQGVLRW